MTRSKFEIKQYLYLVMTLQFGYFRCCKALFILGFACLVALLIVIGGVAAWGVIPVAAVYNYLVFFDSRRLIYKTAYEPNVTEMFAHLWVTLVSVLGIMFVSRHFESAGNREHDFKIAVGNIVLMPSVGRGEDYLFGCDVRANHDCRIWLETDDVKSGRHLSDVRTFNVMRNDEKSLPRFDNGHDVILKIRGDIELVYPQIKIWCKPDCSSKAFVVAQTNMLTGRLISGKQSCP